jgi:intraflagellar transport protein 88
LEAALDAKKKERALAKLRDGAGQADSHPPELAFAVEVQLASCYASAKLWSEALEAYGALVKNTRGLTLQASRCVCMWVASCSWWRCHQPSQPPRPASSLLHGRFRINMGNVHYEQGKFPSAIKQYRMALDALPPSAAAQRSRLTTNIGLAFVQLGQYADAAGTFETALDMAPGHQVGVHAWLVLLLLR